MCRKPLLLKTSVAVNASVGRDGAGGYLITLNTEAFEVNVWVTPDELKNFERVRTAHWVKGSIQIGEAAGARAFWSVGDEADEGDESVSLLIGHDDETWDVGIAFPPDLIDAIQREIAACLATGDEA